MSFQIQILLLSWLATAYLCMSFNYYYNLRSPTTTTSIFSSIRSNGRPAFDIIRDTSHTAAFSSTIGRVPSFPSTTTHLHSSTIEPDAESIRSDEDLAPFLQNDDNIIDDNDGTQIIQPIEAIPIEIPQQFLTDDPSASSTESSISNTQSITTSSSSLGGPELWLDLRGTAMTPQNALSNLQSILSQWNRIDGSTEYNNNNNDNNPHEDHYINPLEENYDLEQHNSQSSTLQMDRALMDAPPSSPNLSTTDTDTLSSSSSTKDKVMAISIPPPPIQDTDIPSTNHPNQASLLPSLPCTTITLSPDKAYVDPMDAIDSLTNGQWVLIETVGYSSTNHNDYDSTGGKQEEENEKMIHIRNLVDLLTGAVSIHSTSSNIRMKDDPEETLSQNQKCDRVVCGGGIAIQCSNNSDILGVSSYIRSLLSSSIHGYRGMTITKSEGGILLQQQTQSNEDNIVQEDTLLSSSMPTSSSSPTIQYAIILPFDAMLWKTAMYILKND